MANKLKSNKKPKRGVPISLFIFFGLLLCLAITAGIGVLNASVLRIRRAEVVLPDLPEGFDGKTILYAADIDLCGLNTPARSGALFNQLQSLKPDMLVLGGDYTSISLLDKLNRPDSNSEDEAKAMALRADFFHYIKSFQAPLGKYAIASTEDVQWQDLSKVLRENDIWPLINEKVDIHAEGDTLWLAGICGKISYLNEAGRSFSEGDCVLVVAEGPEILPILLTSEAYDTGTWADLVLCGHTHGGQIQLLGRSFLSLSEAERRFLSGWNTQNGIPILITEGVGCENINLRLGTEPEVWLISLKKR